jgi:ligand-binding sensor domain-containing protein/AraC-like DNA-binding protein
MKIIVIALILLVSGVNFAQIAHVYSVDEGLAQGYVSALAKDKYDFLWVGTQNGLSRFDGIRFKNFRTGVGEGSIAFNKILQIVTDTSGDVWLTDGTQIQRVCRDNARFESVSMADSIMNYGNILSIVFDSKGDLWVLRKKALFCFRLLPQKGMITATTLLEKRFLQSDFQPITMTLTPDKILIGTGDGVFEYHSEDGRLQKMADCPLKRVTQISKDPCFDGYWFHSAEGIAWWKNGVFKIFPEVKSSPSLKCHVAAAKIGSKSYIASANSLFSWNGTSLQREMSDLSADIISLLADVQGNIWMGTNTQGLVLFNSRKKLIERFAEGKTISEMVGKDCNGTIWNMVIDKKTCWNVYAVNGNRQINAKKYGIDESGHQWLLSCENELQNVTVGRLFPLKNLDRQEAVQKMRCLKGHIIALVKTSGLILINTKTHQEILLNQTSVAPLLHRANAFKQEADGTIWIGMDDGLLAIKAHWESGGVTFQLYKKGASLPNLEILSLEVINAPERVLLLGTLGGLYRFDINKSQYTRFFNDEIPRDEVVYCMQRDVKQRIWLGTNHGLKMYDPNTGKTKWFTIVDGLPASEFNRNTEFLATDGSVFMGTVSGGVHFNPDVLSAAQTDLKMAISDILLNDTMIWQGSYSALECQETDRISIQMALLDFALKPAHRYRYRLLGCSDEWNVTNNSVINFQGLSAGRYTFEICGTNGKSDWTLPMRIEIRVAMPFWKKMGIAVLLLTIFILIAFLLKNWLGVSPNSVPVSDGIPITLSSEDHSGEEAQQLHQKVLALIDLHFKDSEFNVTTIQELLKISKVHLHRKMTAETGYSAAYFLKKRRMEEAENLIKNQPQMTISEIAYASGFSDPNYFSTVFSTVFGQSPRVYRQNLGKND